jgi:hypothetical protein
MTNGRFWALRALVYIDRHTRARTCGRHRFFPPKAPKAPEPAYRGASIACELPAPAREAAQLSRVRETRQAREWTAPATNVAATRACARLDAG